MTERPGSPPGPGPGEQAAVRPPCPDELSTPDAARYLTVSIDTLRKYVATGLLARRNISPPGSGKPRYRFKVADLDRLKHDGYRLATPRPAPLKTGRRTTPAPGPRYEHLDLD